MTDVPVGDRSSAATTAQADVELRLALAMRGGVSLAVWIGGACCEIDELRRAGEPGSAADGAAEHFWTPWLRRAGYARVVVDVMSGASAGGLNGVLYAASQVYGFDYRSMRKVWLDLGSTEHLVRRKEPYPSLFLGDDYFQSTLTTRLSELIASAERPPAHRPSIDLSLSVTYVEPIERAVPSPSDQLLTERRFASGLVFRNPPADQPWRSTDFPALTDARRFAEAMARLGLAGRATSSFPGAFEAAVMRAVRAQQFGGPPAASGGDEIDMGGVLLDRADTPPPGSQEPPLFVVDDGGILDNIPIGRALDAVAAAPADRRTDRLVIYLQPGGSGAAHRKAVPAPEKVVELATRRDTISVLRGMAKSRLGDETINADIAQLEAQNAAIDRAAVIRQSNFAALTSSADLVAAAARHWPNYLLNRAMEDAHRVVHLLDDPIGVLQRDPFPRTLAGNVVADDQWRSPLAGWPAGERERLGGTLTRELGTRPAAVPVTDVFTIGVKPIVRVCGLLIEIARCEEGSTDQATRETASEIKATLYRTRAIVQQLLDEPRSLLWVAAAVGQREPDATVLASTAPNLVDAMCWWPQSTVTPVVDACLGRDGAPIGALPAAALARIDELARTRATDATGREDLRDAVLRRVLVPLAATLARLPAPPPPDPPDAAALLRRVLPVIAAGADVADVADADVDTLVGILAALEVLCLAEYVDGIPGRRPVRYVRMSSENRTPLAPAFTRVLDAAEAADRWWGDSKVRAEQQGLHVDVKLAGNELANFAAFLLPEWRANDWLWGQLDAVPTMVDQLVSIESIRVLLTEHGGDVDAALAVLVPADHPWSGPPFDVDAARAAVRAELVAVGARADDATVATIRNALIATRQWQILAVDLGQPWNPMDPPPASPVDVRHEVAARRFGSETMRDSEHVDQLRDRLGEIATAVGETLIWNVNTSKPAGVTLGPQRAKLVRWLVGRAGPVAIGRVLGGPGKAGGSFVVKAFVALGVLAVVVAAIAGLVRDRLAFALGVVVALAVLAVPVVLVRRWFGKLAGDKLPPPP